jgi:hypothetical protein
MNTSSSANSSDANQSEPDIIPNHPVAPIPNHPLADIIGKFEGEIWEATLEEIQRLRRLDRKRWEKAVEINRDAG